MDIEFLQKHSPKHLLSKAKQDGRLVPFFVITGERDSVVDLSVSVHFKEAYDQGNVPAPSFFEYTLIRTTFCFCSCWGQVSRNAVHIVETSGEYRHSYP